MKEWMILNSQDFESMEEYNSALMKIAYDLKSCGKVVTHEDLLSTFYSKDLLLPHKAKSFTNYNDLLSYLFEIKQRKQKETLSNVTVR